MLVQQWSRTRCADRDTFGFDERLNAVWVRGGCRGVFRCPNSSRTQSCGFRFPLVLVKPERVLCSCGAGLATTSNQGASIDARPRPPARSVAVCITGVQRTLLELPVRRSFWTAIHRPLQARGWNVDPHVVVSANGASETEQALRRDVEAAFHPRTLTVLPIGMTESWMEHPPNEQCALKGAASWDAAEDNGVPSWFNLRQWFAIGKCYDAVEAVERESEGGGSRFAYDWLLRIRTDMAFFDDVPLALGLDPTFAYTLSNGMNSLPHYRCMNDHAFLCPRHLCRPYFKLTELWTSPYCTHEPTHASRHGSTSTGRQKPTSSRPAAAASIFLDHNHAIQWADAPPAVAFALPTPPPLNSSNARSKRLTSQWYTFARYSEAERAGAPCGATEASEQCCGLLREVAWPSSIGRSRAEGLDCVGRLSAPWAVPRPRQPDYSRRPSFQANVSVFIRRCENMQLAWQWDGGDYAAVDWS